MQLIIVLQVRKEQEIIPVTRIQILFGTIFIWKHAKAYVVNSALILGLHSLTNSQPSFGTLVSSKIFTSEGAYYQLNPFTKQVEWYKELGSSLLSFQLQQGEEQIPSSYVLPTLDGHFMYVDTHSQLLVVGQQDQVKREEVEQLLKVCLEGRSKKLQPSVQYFVYDKFEYYIIDLEKGNALDLQSFLKKGLPSSLNSMVVLKNTKKYLKQLKADLSVAWSTISSDLQLIPAPLFLQDPKTTSLIDPSLSELSFSRTSGLQVVMEGMQQTFSLGGKSHIISIFEKVNNGYLKHSLGFSKKERLALQQANKKHEIHYLIEKDRLEYSSSPFLHSEQIRNRNNCQLDDLEQCVNLFRTLQAVSDQSKDPILRFPQSNNFSLSIPTSECVPPQKQLYGPTQNQPYLLVGVLGMMATVGVLGFGVFRLKISSLQKEIEVMESKTGQKMEEFKKKLGQMEQLKKMYEVYWDQMLWQASGQQWAQHIVFKGKFLNQPSLVYAVKLEGTDVVSLEHRLNILLNFSHTSLSKLYYYTRNSEFLLVFTEMSTPLSIKEFPGTLISKFSSSLKKSLISQILSAIAYLDSKIEVNCLPKEAVSLEILVPEEGEPSYKFKINSVSCLLRRGADDSDCEQSRSGSGDNHTFELRLNLIAMFNLIIKDGAPFLREQMQQKLRKEAYSQEQYLQFFDFILYQVRSRGQKEVENQNQRDSLFRDILDHPYLWDSKRKILFLSDFSNYIETHIDQTKVRKLQSHAKEYKVIKTPWIREFHFTFVREVSNYRKYDYESVRDLIRVIRNKLNHFHQIPREVRLNIGTTPEGFIEYCLQLFPKLLHFAFVYTRKKKWKLHMK